MTWLLPDTNWMFIHIPKTGGTSIHKSLREGGYKLVKPEMSVKLAQVNLNPKLKQIPPHSKISELVLCGLNVNQHNFFAQVRNPYTRLVSLYYFVQQQDRGRIEGHVKESNLKAPIEFYTQRHNLLNNMTFTQFAERVTDTDWQQAFDDKWLIEYTSQLRYGWQLQHEWLDGADVNVFKLEKSDKIVKFIKDQKVPFTYERKKNQGIRDYMNHYTPQTRDIVYNYYKEDFERYEYSR